MNLTASLRTLWLGLALIGVSTFAAAPSITVTNSVRSGGNIRLGWSSSTAGFQYTVETRGALSGGDWTPFPGMTWPVTATTVDLPEASVSDTAFFRVRATAPPVNRGAIISVTQGSTFTVQQIQFLLLFQGITGVPVRNGVRFYKVVYETVDPHGLSIRASGAMAVPDGVSTPIPITSYQHGTITEREDVPSRLTEDAYLGVALASAGYLVTMPDYLGLGDSPGLHPYHHAATEASATIDLLRSAKGWCSSNSVSLSSKLFLVGYSQGGHATLAAMRELEASHTNEFTVTAVSAGAGAYDLAGVTADALLRDTPYPNPFYLSYIVAAYAQIYPIGGSFSELLTPPYNTTVPPLFDGTRDASAINAAVPSVPANVLREDYRADLRARADHPLRVALRENSLVDWTPRAPLRLYHCAADLDVPPANMQVAYDSFISRGAVQVQKFDPQPTADHGGCAEPSLLATLAWFESLR